MISRRQVVLAIGAGALTVRHSSFAQQQSKVWRIGFLAARSHSTPSNPDVYYDAFVQGMRELGYVEGKNLVIEWLGAEEKYDRLPALAAELVGRKPDVLVTAGTPATRALQLATRVIPVVAVANIDPVGSGFAESLSRPGGNITGMSQLTVGVSSKHLELLTRMVPGVSRVALLLNPDNAANASIAVTVQAAAQSAGLRLLRVEARSLEEIERGFVTMKRERSEAVIVASDGMFVGRRRQIADLLTKNRLPSIFPFPEDVEAGALMSYGVNLAEIYRRGAAYVDKIFKGAKPGDLPIEQASKFELVINMKTAKALGIKVPNLILVQATKVIE